MSRAVPAALLLLTLVGCGGNADDRASDGSATPTSSSTSTVEPVVPPGDQDAATWAPTVPDEPVDPDVVTAYAPVLDAVVAATAGTFTWGEVELSTERFGDLCVLKLQQSGTGSPPTDVDALVADVSEAVTGLGFGDLAPQDDPGGAVTLVAHDSSDALLELRSKGDTTVAVRVATTDTQCS